ncbi:MAG: hypothetical protein RMK89_13335 [Armatimonadota bacterium]|nr:hypothetical protein [Armatimonadota bacterium]MDW8144432.1 hypothetical protein [Armatimonadota bacterium]
MSKTGNKKRRSLLEKRITELVMLAKELCPESEVIVRPPFEADEDAVIEVRVPPEKYELVDEALLRRETQILYEDGFFIVTLVYEKKPPEPLAATKE